jgi:glycosyltransferase involved in cell wall biosynthesis
LSRKACGEDKVKVLYLTFGTQSGVAVKLSNELLNYNCYCTYANITNCISYRYAKVRLPRVSFATAKNLYIARRTFGQNWKEYYLRTDYAYDKMSRSAEALIARSDCDVVMQSGLIFSPENTKQKPYVIGILDNTYLIGKLGRNRTATSLPLEDEFVDKEREAYRRADLIFAMSEHVRDSLIEDYGVSPGRICVSGVGPNIEPDHDYEPSPHKYSSKKIVMIAMEFGRKGGAELLQAFEMVRRSIPGIELTVIGERMDIQMDGVSFAGVQDREKIKQALSEANLYVMPSHAEPFGVAFIEAMAFHTPCIGSTVEAIPEIISDGATGYVVAPEDVGGIAERMEKILRDPLLSRTMGAAGRKKYEERFSWARVGQLISERLQNLSENFERQKVRY